MNKLKTLAMVDVAEHILKENNEPMEIQALFKAVAEIKEISIDNVDKLTQLYMDITQSGRFVYAGDDKWDLKIGNLHLWDDDGSSFITVDLEEEQDELDFLDFIIEDEDELVEDDEDEDDEDIDEQEKEAIQEEREYIAVELPLTSTDDDDDVDFDADSYEDEEDYNEIMDDYEDMYDE